VHCVSLFASSTLNSKTTYFRVEKIPQSVAALEPSSAAQMLCSGLSSSIDDMSTVPCGSLIKTAHSDRVPLTYVSAARAPFFRGARG
jgi:hypothetical protein